ncbi:MAG: InlB B-repeat-containing protein, partial [Oscillospiraceae bacterium]|nr:InlB B-repeat-containing protein [Oscillospiraceae bacterium]
MFCKYCGSAIDLSKMKCTVCGREVGQLAGGNSFWDLSQNPPQPEIRRADAMPQRAAEESAKTLQEIERLSGEVQKLRSSYSKTRSQLSKLALTSVLLSAVAIILCIVLALRVFLPPKNVDEPVSESTEPAENQTVKENEPESKPEPDTEVKIALGEDGQPHTPDDWYEEDKNGDGVPEKVYVGEDGIAGTDDDYWTAPIVFDATEGTIDGERYLKGDASTFNALPTATREGYDLDGWFTEADGGTKISLSDVRNAQEAKTFYAHWT